MILLPRALLVLSLAFILGACASKPVEPYVRPAPEHALPVRTDTVFAGIESGLRGAHGADASGFELIDRNEEGLRWRLALIDSARHSIDAQYYLWYGDAAGRLLLKRLLDAADRGVKVRMLVDDLNTLLEDAGTLVQRDGVAAWIDAHPNIELRLFNPWKDREIVARAGEMAVDFERLDHRMHNKALIVDNQATILGGRNIGDDYMGLHETFNFHDLDVLGIGPVARQASAVFDLYWNSDWVMPASALRLETTEDAQRAGRARLNATLAEMQSLERFPLAPRSWTAELAALNGRLHPGSSRVVSDVPASGTIRQVMVEEVYALASTARQEVLVINAYIIPSQRTVDSLRESGKRGVRTRILTNSLASHDVPAVNSHYKKWRKPILESGAELHELRHDAAIQSEVADTLPTRAKFVGLHSKGMVIDRKRVYIGSMNFDPRSAQINSEMGVFVESQGLAEALARLIERDMQPANSWKVELDDADKLRWTNDREVVTHQPARSWWQRVEDILFMTLPEEYY